MFCMLHQIHPEDCDVSSTALNTTSAVNNSGMLQQQSMPTPPAQYSAADNKTKQAKTQQL